MAKKRKQEAEEHVNHERWLITYADLITLLMVFFVVMYSMSRADTNKFAKLSASLKRAFNVEVLKGTDPTALRGNDGNNIALSVIQDVLASSVAVVPDAKMVNTAEIVRKVLIEHQPQDTTGGQVQMGATRDGVVISLSGNVLFDSGRAELRPQGLDLLDDLAAKLRDMPNDIRIEGHTDNVAIATSLYPSNWELSSARATTVGRYLIEHGGIAAKRVGAVGYGEWRPVASNDSREGRAQNRRVDVVILFPQVPITGGGSNVALSKPIENPIELGGQ